MMLIDILRKAKEEKRDALEVFKENLETSACAEELKEKYGELLTEQLTVEELEDYALAGEALAEYEREGKKSRPIGELWKELGLDEKPNDETLAAIDEAEDEDKLHGPFDSVKALMATLNLDGAEEK